MMRDKVIDYLLALNKCTTWDRQSGGAGDGQDGLEPRLRLHPGRIEAEAQGRQWSVVAPGSVETCKAMHK